MITVLVTCNFLLLLTLVGIGMSLIKLIRSLDTTLSLDPNLTLQEVLKSLELAAKLAAKVGKDLEINLAESRQQFSRLVVLLDRLQMDVTAGDEAAALVASDLAESQDRARHAGPPHPPGSAGDAAASGRPSKQTTTRKPRAAKKPKT